MHVILSNLQPPSRNGSRIEISLERFRPCRARESVSHGHKRGQKCAVDPREVMVCGGSLLIPFLSRGGHLAPSYFRQCEYRKVRGPSPREVERVPKINDEPIERRFMRSCATGGRGEVRSSVLSYVTLCPHWPKRFANKSIHSGVSIL